ncbi:MAG: hypothetical protein ABWY64_09050 [Tardiphaga sp.]
MHMTFRDSLSLSQTQNCWPATADPAGRTGSELQAGVAVWLRSREAQDGLRAWRALIVLKFSVDCPPYGGRPVETEAENLAADIVGAWARKDHAKADLLKKAETSIAPARKFVDQLNRALSEGSGELSARFGDWDAKEDAVYIPLYLFTPGGQRTITLKIQESGFVSLGANNFGPHEVEAMISALSEDIRDNMQPIALLRR